MMTASATTPVSTAIAKPLLHAFLAWGLVVAIVALLGFDTNGWWLVPLFAGSAFAGWLVWRGYRWPDSWSIYISFGGAVLLALVANRFLFVADFFISGARFNEWPFFSNAPEWAVLKGEAITLVGTLITVAVWLAAGGAKYSPRMVLRVPRPALVRLLLVAYAMSLLGSIILRSDRETTAVFGQLFPLLHGLGVACCFLLPLALARSHFVALCAAGLLSSPFIYFSLNSGMKEEIIVALLPAGYLAWNATRSTAARLAIVAAAFLFVSVITPFVGFYRDQAWYGKRELSADKAVSEFTAGLSAQGSVGTMSSGLEAFVRRNNASLHRGWAVSLADEYGYEPELVFAPIFYVFVPRFLWPEKPLIQQGWEYSGLVFGKDYMAWSSSSTAAGLYTAFYLGYGWPAVLAGAVLIGLLTAGMFHIAWRVGGASLVGMYGLSLLPFALRLDETWTVGAVSGPVISLAYLVVLHWIARLISLVVKP